MTPLELSIILLLGTTCGTIHATSPEQQLHSVYERHDELNLRLQVACIELKGRDKYIQAASLKDLEKEK